MSLETQEIKNDAHLSRYQVKEELPCKIYQITVLGISGGAELKASNLGKSPAYRTLGTFKNNAAIMISKGLSHTGGGLYGIQATRT